MIPSMAALVIPPAYPAPSPQGYIFSVPMAIRDSLSLSILTGALVLVSAPVRIAEAVANPLIFLSKLMSASLIAPQTNGGRYRSGETIFVRDEFMYVGIISVGSEIAFQEENLRP